MYLVDRVQAPTAQAAVGAFLTAQRIVNDGVQIRKGTYDYRQLTKWKDELPDVLGIRGAVFTDIDEATNRLRIGVEDLALQLEVETVLQTHNIPLQAVIVEASPPVHFAATLRDRIRPTNGGLQIAFGGFLCTLGFIAKIGGPSDPARYGVTNSHCSNVQGGVEGTQYFQATNAPGNMVGTEFRDPVYRTRTTGDIFCPAGRRCRYSDALMFQFTTPSEAALGYLTRTTSRGSLTGSITVNAANPKFAIESLPSLPTVGQQVNKIGERTGWTFGSVQSTCRDYNVGGTDITLHCQDLVNAGADHGDSGSPVFSNDILVFQGVSYVSLYGILWGVFDPAHNQFVMSQMGYIRSPSELGSFTACAQPSASC